MNAISEPLSLSATIPGPDRKRTPSAYEFRIVYFQPASEPGCRIMWEVTGGRLPYQVVLEQIDGDHSKWHCTCADAVYRGESEANHFCKHVRGLMESPLFDSSSGGDAQSFGSNFYPFLRPAR